MYTDHGSTPTLATVKQKAGGAETERVKMRCLLLLEFLWWKTEAEVFALVHRRNTRHKAITLLCTVISCLSEFFFLMFFFSSSVRDKYGLNAVSLIRASPVTLSVTSA